MRLLNIETNDFHEFFDADIPEYAILSHRWGDSEVSYQHFSLHQPWNLQGHTKIRHFCDLAHTEYACEWAWVDTCCIDKSSSAELSEAINSMYRWYADAHVCLAYLSDVDSLDDLAASTWFTRGWTLQELLAPSRVEFYNKHWQHLGNRNTLARIIHSATSIPMDVIKLEDEDDPDPYYEHSRVYNIQSKCVAEKMSWASRRATSRSEDMAYCLLGLFNVNMPLLYGEGHKAFRRLQQEILRSSDDESIFAWGLETSPTKHVMQEFLASSPRDFAASARIVQSQTVRNRRPYQLTNKGLQMQAHVLDLRVPGWQGPGFAIPINCVQLDANGLVGFGSSAVVHQPDVLAIPVGWFQSDPVFERYHRNAAPVIIRARYWDAILQRNAKGPVRNIGKMPTKEIFLKI